MGTKNNPGQYDCYAAAQDDEPFFLLLARDPLAPLLVRLWADIRQQNAGPGEVNDDQLNKLQEARMCAVEMTAWARVRAELQLNVGRAMSAQEASEGTIMKAFRLALTGKAKEFVEFMEAMTPSDRRMFNDACDRVRQVHMFLEMKARG